MIHAKTDQKSFQELGHALNLEALQCVLYCYGHANTLRQGVYIHTGRLRVDEQGFGLLSGLIKRERTLMATLNHTHSQRAQRCDWWLRLGNPNLHLHSSQQEMHIHEFFLTKALTASFREERNTMGHLLIRESRCSTQSL